MDGDLYSSDLLWDDIPRADSVLGGDSIWHLAASRDEEDAIVTSSQSLLHSHDPLLTSAVVTVGDETEQVNDLLFDELERITISNPSPSPQLDLGMVSLFFHYLPNLLAPLYSCLRLPASPRIHQQRPHPSFECAFITIWRFPPLLTVEDMSRCVHGALVRGDQDPFRLSMFRHFLSSSSVVLWFVARPLHRQSNRAWVDLWQYFHLDYTFELLTETSCVRIQSSTC